MAKRGTLKVATCQFASTASVRRNGAMVRRQMDKAKRMGAQLVHFHETALSGYCGAEMSSWKGFDWEALREETEAVCNLARKKSLWVVLGSSHLLTGRHKPHNSLYVISPAGKLVDRYDKRFCTGGDLRHYSPGDHFVTFEVNGVKLGLLICYDVRFPELYRAYRKQGVQCMLHSFYNARHPKRGILSTIMTPNLMCRAATNYMWVSAPNASAHYQAWPSVMIQPDGSPAGRLQIHRAGVMVNTVDTTRKFYDAAGKWRERAMRGHLNSGTTVRDPRSRNRGSL